MPAWLIPVIGAVAGLAGSILQSKAQGKAAEEQARLYNDYLRLRQQGVNDIIAATQARGYDPFGPQTATGTTSSQGTSVTDQSSRTMPEISPEYAALEQGLRAIIQNRINRPASLPAGYAQMGLRNINKAYEGQRQDLINAASRRNLPAGALLTGSPVERARAGAAADFLTTLPLRERELQNEDLGLASGAISAFGRGQTMQGRSVTRDSRTGTSTMTTPPNYSALASLILPEGPMAGSSSGRSTTGDILSGLSQAYFANAGVFGGGGGNTNFQDGYFDDNGNWIPIG